MNFTKAGIVREAVDAMRSEEEMSRSQNRARINDLFNGAPPFTDDEAPNTNVNFLEATTIAHRARSTWNNAMLKPGNRFTVTLNCGPAHKKTFWSHSITQRINRPLKRSAKLTENIRATGAQVVLHGIGPSWWPDYQLWHPEEIGLDDLLIPSATRVNLSNLTHFAIFQQFTAGQLNKLTDKKHRDPGWRMKTVQNELRRIAKDYLGNTLSEHEMSSPEKLAEYYKSNAGLWDTDKIPTVNVWSFFHKDDDGSDRWYKRMILDAPASGSDDFLYSSNRPCAGDLSQLLHFNFGDGANVVPFLYHSVRSLGFLLYATCHLQNRLRCRFSDAIFEATLQYFKNINSGDRARVEKIELHDRGLIPEGVTMVGQADRWQVNTELVMAGLSQNRQLMAENASAYVQDINDGTSKELTATEVMARLNSANALVSSLLSQAYVYEQYKHLEIARRFTIRNSKDKDVQTFREGCLQDGIPEKYLNIEAWDVEPDRVMGGGNKTLEIAQSRSLMEIKPQLDPPAQRTVLRQYILSVTDDADLAFRLVPADGQKENPSAHDAELSMGPLMAGTTVRVRHGIDHISYVDAMLAGLLDILEDVDAMMKGGEMPSGERIVGLVNVVMHVQKHIAIIGQDPAEKQRVRQYGDALKNIMNKLTALSQQLDEQREAKAQQNGQEEQAKAEAITMLAQVKAKVAEFNAQQKAQIAQQKFAADEARKDAAAAGSVQREAVMTAADIEALDATTAAKVKATKETAKAKAAAKPSPKKA